jgi:hypothetical protein
MNHLSNLMMLRGDRQAAEFLGDAGAVWQGEGYPAGAGEEFNP